MSLMATETKKTTKFDLNVKKPNMYKVIFNNDEVTPADFVEGLLIAIFHHNAEKAQEITNEIHNTGKGIAGIYTFEIAEQKHTEATYMARSQGHPLNINVEPE
jgi:ATP-dependent Clp protease adaptor protein ClpS